MIPAQKFVLSVPATNKIPSVEQTLQDAAGYGNYARGNYTNTLKENFSIILAELLKEKKEPKTRV